MHNKTIAYLFLFFFSMTAPVATYCAEGASDTYVPQRVQSLQNLAFETVIREGKDLEIAPNYQRGNEPLYLVPEHIRVALVRCRRGLQNSLDNVVNDIKSNKLQGTAKRLFELLEEGAVLTEDMKKVFESKNYLYKIINAAKTERVKTKKSVFLPLMAELLRQGVNKNCYFKDFVRFGSVKAKTLLSAACEAGLSDFVTLFLEVGAEVRMKDANPLKKQLEKSHNLDVIKAFITAKKEVNKILFWASENGALEVIDLALENGGNPSYAKGLGENAISAIESAVGKARSASRSCSLPGQERYWLTVKRMLKKCDRETVLRESYANALLYGAARFGDVDLARLAHSFGAIWSFDYLDLAFLNVHHNVIRVAAQEQPSLFERVVAQGKFNSIKRMLPFVSQGIKDSALYTASSSGDVSMVKLLLDYNADKSNKVNGQTARQVAGNEEVAKLLATPLEKFSDLSQQQSQGFKDLFNDERSFDQSDLFCVHRTTIDHQLGIS